MIIFKDFYDDLEFMYALLSIKILNLTDIKYIADKLVIKDSDNLLIDILVTNENDEVEKLFREYLINKKIKIIDANKVIVKKIFIYILSGKIGLFDGMDFIHEKIILEVGSRVYVGDKLGIQSIYGDYDTLKDMVEIYGSPKEEIKIAENTVKLEMQEYIKNN